MLARLFFLGCFFSAAALAQAPARTQVPDVIYVPTPYEVVDAMLRLADVKKGDVLVRSGRSTGSILIDHMTIAGD